jgi:Proton-conducting membrane transporter
VTIVAFLAVCVGGAALSQLTQAYRRLGPVVAVGGLAAACAAALLIGPSDGVTIGEVRLSGSAYASTFLASATAACLLLYLVGLGSGWPDRLAPAALAAFGSLGVALTTADPGVALTAAAAAAATGAVVSVRAGAGGEKPDNRLSEARTLALLVGSLLFAAIAVSRPSWADQDSTVFALGFLGLGAALAVRSGSIPFHVPAANLGKRGPSIAPALLLVWIPAAIGLLAVSWSATTFDLRTDWLDAATTAVQLIAVATLVLGATGALLHDDLTEVAVYSIVGDSGFILLALASRNDGAAEPARLWLLAFLAAKTGFVAWAAAVSHAFGSSNLGELRGWLRRTPILGLALVAVAMATLGWPGSPVYEARSTLIGLALPDWLGFVGAAAIALALACYGRLLLVGLLAPTGVVTAASGERPRWSSARPAATPDATAAATLDVAATAKASAAATPEAATIATLDAATAAAPDAPALKPKRKTSGAAAAERAPAKTALPPASPPDDAPTAPASRSPAGPGLRGRLILAWGMNGTLRVSGAVLAAAALALALSFGGLGASDASRGGIPFDIPTHATPVPTPSPTPPPTPSPEPTLAPIASHNPRPSASLGPSGPPNSSANPTRSSIPAPLPIQ